MKYVKQVSKKTKLRFIKEYSQKQYITELDFKRCKMMMEIRLNMIEIKCNYEGIFKDNLKCEMCKLGNDTTEHLLKCTSNESIQNNVDKLTKPDNNVVQIIEQNISKRESLG